MLRLALPLLLALPMLVVAQATRPAEALDAGVVEAIGRYQAAREAGDEAALRALLDDEADQLVSSGEWRRGVDELVAGMGRSSEQNPGSRQLTVETVRVLGEVALADARYRILAEDGTSRDMWSTFVLVKGDDGAWRITAIRNMKPTGY